MLFNLLYASLSSINLLAVPHIVKLVQFIYFICLTIWLMSGTHLELMDSGLKLF